MNFILRPCNTLAIALLLLVLAPGCTSTKPATFASPEDAVNALVTAVRAHDKPTMHHILGSGGDEILSSGDEVADRQTADRFIERYDEQHRIETSDEGFATLVIGNNEWPMPIPVVRDSNKSEWYFDTDAGREEILNRRVGRNELDVIQVCRAIVDAQLDYVQIDPNGNGVPEYAARFLSDPGKKNGLYWKTAEGEKESPLGPLISAAIEKGYTASRNEKGEANPYHGYYFHMLTSQGPHAEGGACDYMLNGKMLGGFAAIAWPAQYGNSGVMTFIVNYRGVVYQKDLGKNTAKSVMELKAFDPDETWQKVEPQATTQP